MLVKKKTDWIKFRNSVTSCYALLYLGDEMAGYNQPISDTIDETVAFNRIKQWGICDWRDTAAYPDSRSTDNDMWRWEFLRRDPQYRERWLTWYNGQGQTASPDELISFGLRDFLDPSVSYKKLVKKRPYIFQQYPAILDSNEVNWVYEDTDDRLESDIQSILNDTDSLIDIRIDLKRPITPQMESMAIRNMLCERQKKLVGRILRHRDSDDSVLYLRAIDAIFVGVKNATIGKHIFGGTTKPSQAARGRQAEKKVRNMWQEF